eukprot:309832_1
MIIIMSHWVKVNPKNAIDILWSESQCQKHEMRKLKLRLVIMANMQNTLEAVEQVMKRMDANDRDSFYELRLLWRFLCVSLEYNASLCGECHLLHRERHSHGVRCLI